MAGINLVIQVQDNNYYPRVKNTDPYRYVGKLAVTGPEPVKNTQEDGETLANIIQVINEDNKQRMHAYEQCCKRISSHVIAKELTYEQLREFYTTHLPVHPNGQNISVPTLEQSQEKLVIAGAPQKGRQHTTELLINAIAYWGCTNQVDPDILFDQIGTRPGVSMK
ncbi:Uncharacterised protein [Legionella wadsworthii]|uniref:Uncharacterized protein n=1 Tax=Legionella wadsworthii TaxID=28088 RepID=A0A378LQ16_9GAMM|nr:hypothetical protein [Legionella wadsworthii]STY27889.1 Uncharacterised protein [Legionella wadsworthii]